MAKKIKKQMDTVSEMVYKPTLSVSTKQLPVIKDWKVGKEYELKVKTKMIGIREDNYDEKNAGKYEGTFEILEIKEV